MPNAFVDYYRSPEELSNFSVREPLSADAGYFQFRGAVLYGRASRSGLPTCTRERLSDTSADVEVRSGGVGLPFDLTEVVGNLRNEQYQRNGQGVLSKMAGSAPSERLYYVIRPMLPVAVRKHLQRVRLNGWDRIPFPSWPVDLTVETLMESAMALSFESSGSAAVPFIWFWPDGASAAVIVTHDVEAPAGYAFIERLLDIDAAFGIRSSFQIVPELRYATSPQLFDTLRRRGFEVNVHDLNHDGRLFQNHEQFRTRAARISRYAREFGCRGFRAACMYREQDWFDALDVSYDMSVPNVAHLEPQRGGCCTVLPYFIRDLVELPLTTIQDYSLFHILGQYSIEIWKQQIELIASRHGLITILSHPDYLIEPRAQGVYRDLLAHLRGLREGGNWWFALPGDVEHWWRSRSRMVLRPHNGSWQIEGPESHRARLAWATVEHGTVVYRVVDRCPTPDHICSLPLTQPA